MAGLEEGTLPHNQQSSQFDGSHGRPDGLARELLSFVEEHVLLIWTVIVALTLSYGFGLTHFSLSIDEETHLINDNVRAWFVQGRPGIGLLKILRSEWIPLPFLNMLIATLTLGGAAVLWCFVFVQLNPRLVKADAALAAFAAFFVSVPVNSYYLAFSTYCVEVSIGHLLVAMASLTLVRVCLQSENNLEPTIPLSVMTRKMAISSSLVLVAISIYQSFLFTSVAAVLALGLVASGSRQRIWLIRHGLVVVASGAAAYLLVFLMSRQISSGYTDSFFNWTKLPVDFIISWLARSAIHLMSGVSSAGLVVPAALLVGIVSVIAFAARLTFSRALASAFLIIGLAASPFLLSVVMGTAMPFRSQQVLPLAYGTMLLLPALICERSKVLAGALWVAVLWIVLIDAQQNTRLFLTKYLTYTRDVSVANEIAARLHSQGWDGGAAAIVISGRMRDYDERFLLRSETFGASTLTWDRGARAPAFMRHLGYRMLGPTAEQHSRAAEFGRSMSAWPTLGSVKYNDGVAVVKMSD